MRDLMNRFFVSTRTFLQAEEGQATTEYALVLVLVVAAAVTAVGLLTGQLSTWFQQIVDAFGK